jgi:hypothetical protein
MKYILALLLVSCATLTAQEPPELSTLRESWKKARIAALSPLDKKYMETLEAMKDKFTRAGKLPEANAITAEIEKVLPDLLDTLPRGFVSIDPRVNDAETRRKLNRSVWAYKSADGEWTISFTGRDSCQWKNEGNGYTTDAGKWAVTKEGVTIQFPGETFHRLIKFEPSFTRGAVTVQGNPAKDGTFTRK